MVYDNMCSSKDNGKVDRLGGSYCSSRVGVSNFVYCNEECEVRAVEVESALVKTEDAIVDALDADEIVDALECVLDSGAVGESERPVLRVDGRRHSHLRGTSALEALRTNLGSSLTSGNGRGRRAGLYGVEEVAATASVCNECHWRLSVVKGRKWRNQR
jgi:hypothetical protein